jgi:hypothetical protein
MPDEPWAAIDWTAFPAPYIVWGDKPSSRYSSGDVVDLYRAEAIPGAFRRLLSLADGEEGEGAIAFEYAIGNPHGGTIYPAAEAVVPILLDVIERLAPAPREAVAEVLMDIASFYPQVPPEGPHDLRERIHAQLKARRDVLERVIADSATRPTARQYLADVFNIMERWP